MRLSSLEVLAFLAALALLGSCEGGSMGCSGCSGCGMEPLPGDFPLDKRVENAAQVHVSGNALEFLENNYDPMIYRFFPNGLFLDIPEMTQDVEGIGTVDICPGGGCSVNLQVLNLSITPMPPSTIRLVMQMGMDIHDLPLRIRQGLLCSCWEDCNCSVDLNTADSGRPYDSFHANFIFDIDAATDYTKLRMSDSQVAEEIEDGDLSITNTNSCGLAPCNIASLGFVKGIIVDQITSSLKDSLEDPLNESMCRTCASGCPAGTSCEGENPEDACIYPDGTCVSIVLGLMGGMNAGSLLQAFSPTTSAVLDVLAAAGGYAATSGDPEAIDLGLFGGAEPAPASDCVRKAPVPCETGADCSPGYSCLEIAAPPVWLLPCRRCADGCPAGSSPRSGKPCQPDPDNPLEDFDPTQPCMNDDGSCVPILYCQDTAGRLQEFQPPGSQAVPVAEVLKTDQFTHCLYCETDEDCTAPYACDMYGVCTDNADPPACQTVTDPVMVVIGVSETFLRRALFGAASSGALCLEIPPGAIPQLSSETLVMAMPHIETLVWDPAPVVLVLRPTISSFSVARPELDAMDSPDIEVSDSPLLKVFMRDVSIDFYLWTEETYSRFLTATFDFSLGIDLFVKGGTITPILRNPEVSDVRAYNNDLLPFEDQALRNIIKGLVELAMGFVPGIDPIELPEIDMFRLSLPDGAAAHVRESGEDFLALYANLASAAAAPPPPPASPIEVDTSVALVGGFNPVVDLERGTAAMYDDPGGRPSFVVALSAHSPSILDRPVEYRTRLNGGPWSRWCRSETATIESYEFIFQGRHRLEAQARIVGEPETEDGSPASMELLVDGVPPWISGSISGTETLEVTVRDMVSRPEKITVSAMGTLSDGTASRLESTHGGASIDIGDPRLVSVEVRAVDEAGNESSRSFEIRGRPPVPEDTGSACMGCAAVGSRGDAGPGAAMALISFAVLVILLSRSTRRPRAWRAHSPRGDRPRPRTGRRSHPRRPLRGRLRRRARARA
jgi:hypothetical protein